MQLRQASLLFPLAAIALSSPLGALSEPDLTDLQLDATAHATRSSFGLSGEDGVLRGGGPNYRVDLDAAGFLFTPALGRQAPRNFPLRFELDSIARGDTLLHTATPTAPTRIENRALYARGASIVERYDVTADGVEQSFLFRTEPEGEGDIVVRGRLSTEWELVEQTASGALHFELTGFGTLGYGAVTGVDAHGNTAPGSTVLAGDQIELRLPAAFVDRATYPMILDPFVDFGPSISTAGGDDSKPDIAFDWTTGRYLVVWEMATSLVQCEIRGQMFTYDMQPASALLMLSTNTLCGRNPSVANVNLNNRFLVAFEAGSGPFQPSRIECLLVRASNSHLSDHLELSDGSGTAFKPDVGGDSTNFNNNALVVWEEAGSAVHGAVVDVPADDDPTLESTFVLTTNWTTNPSITKAGGASGRHMIVWEREYIPDHDIVGCIVDLNGSIVTTPENIDTTINWNEELPAVAGDGDDFWITYQQESSPGADDFDVLVKRVTFDGELDTSDAPKAIGASPFKRETEPTVAYSGTKVFVAWTSRTPGQLWSEVVFSGYHPTNCKSCDHLSIIVSSVASGAPALVSEHSGSTVGAGDRLLLGWHRKDIAPPFQGAIHLASLAGIGSGGSIVDNGGGCGGGGTFTTSGAFAIGNPSFEFLVDGADPAATLGILAINTEETVVSCGPCDWLLWPSIPGLVFVRPASGGSASMSVPMPCSYPLLGVELHAQWMMTPTLDSPCSLFSSTSMSNRLALELGL